MEVNGKLHAPATLLLGKDPDTQWLEGWICHRAYQDIVATMKHPLPTLAGSQTLVIQPTA